MNRLHTSRGPGSDGPHLKRLATLYVFSSVVGVGGYVGGLIAATQLEDMLGDMVRTTSIAFFLVMGLVRERFRTPPRWLSIRNAWSQRPDRDRHDPAPLRSE